MPLHLLKLCVGAESIADLQGWIDERVALARRFGQPEERMHTTRMMPKRREEIIAGGSLYWVIKGQMAARQRLIDIRPFIDDEGIGRCDLVLAPQLVPVRMRPCRPFQGWRYLLEKDAPLDANLTGQSGADMPEALLRELSDMGLM